MDINIQSNDKPTDVGTTVKVESNTTRATNSNNQQPNTFGDDDLDKEYIDKRDVVISLVHNYSAYRRANMKAMGHKTETIGSSVTSCRILSSHKGEIEAYFPPIVGVAYNHPEFVTRVKSWLSNIRFVVNNDDAHLNTSFIYNKKSDYLKIAKREAEIDRAYDSIDRSVISDIKEALKKKIADLNDLESTKYQYGRPENVEEYLIYRHCLLYAEVAKDSALINSDDTYRFYIKDEAKEEAKRKQLTEERLTAMRNFIEISASDTKFNSVYVAINVYENKNLAVALLKDKSEKNEIMMKFVNANPDKFNRIIKDKHLAIKAFIETLISRGELSRSSYNQQISTADGSFVGSNMNEAIAFFNNPENKEIRTAYENKLKLF